MDYADAIRRQAENAPRAALPAVTAALWRAFGEGHVTEAEAEALSALIEARQVSPKSGENADRSGILRSPNTGISMPSDPALPVDRQRSLRTGAGSRPRTDASLERRRRWASSGRLPPALAAKFTLSEQATLSLVAAEAARRGDCRLSVPHMAALVGVAETTVRNAIREARKLGLLTVEERRITGFRNDTNVVRIISPEWTAWLRLARKGVTVRDPLGRKGGPLSKSGSSAVRHTGVVNTHPLFPQSGGNVSAPTQRRGRHGPTLDEGGGCKFANRTPTQVLKTGKNRRCRPN